MRVSNQLWFYSIAVSASVMLFFSSVYSQPLWLKEVAAAAKGKSFDPKASMAVLHSSAAVQISEKLKSTAHMRQVYKVLLPEGKSMVTLSEAGSKNYTVNNLQGWSLLPDGQVLELKKTDIFKMGALEDVAYYTDSYTLYAVPPKIEMGAIIAFEYDIEENGLTALDHSFDLQDQQPVLSARFTITAPKGWQIKYSGYNLEPIKFEESTATLTATAADLPYRPEEPYMPPWSFLSRRIFVVAVDPDPANKSSIRSWQDVADWYREILAQIEKEDPELIKTTQEVIKGCATAAEKLNAISRFVQEKIRYVALEFSKGAYIPRPATETLTNMHGDCKDKAVLMCKLLQVAGVKAVPALTNSSYLIRRELPNPGQFNHVIVAVPYAALEGAFASERALVKDWLFIDPTDPTTRVGDIPAALQGSYALPVCNGQTELIHLPYGSVQHYAREYSADARLQPDGSLSSRITVKYFGNYAKERRYINQFRTSEEQIEAWRDMLDSTIPNVEISHFSTWDKVDTTWEQFDVSGPSYLPQSEDYFLLKVDFITDPEHPKLTSPVRHHDIWLGRPTRYHVKIVWHLPEGWQVNPAAHQILHDDAILQLSCSISWQDPLLYYEYLFERSGLLMGKEEYARAQACDAKHVLGDGLTLLIKKPATAGSNRSR